jgi:hypothetical protein
MKSAIRTKRAIFEKTLQLAKANLKTKKEELKSAKHQDADIRKRKFQFDDGLPIAFHRFENRFDCDLACSQSLEQIMLASRAVEESTAAVIAAKTNWNKNQSQMYDVLRSQLFEEEIKEITEKVSKLISHFFTFQMGRK